MSTVIPPTENAASPPAQPAPAPAAPLATPADDVGSQTPFQPPAVDPASLADPVPPAAPAVPPAVDPAAPPVEPAVPQSLRDMAVAAGIPVDNIDDAGLQAHLIQQAQTAKQTGQLAEYGQRYIDNAADFETYMRERAQPAATPQEPEAPLWNPPEINQTWLTQVERNPETGRLQPINGGTPETVQRVERYLTFQDDQRTQFWKNPHEYMQPMVEQVATRVAQDMIGQQLNQRSAEDGATQFVKENTEWLFAKDQSGGIARDPRGGGAVLTAEGQLFSQFVQQADAWGMPAESHQNYAMTQLQAYRALNPGQQPAAGGAAAAAPPPLTQDQQFLQTAAGFVPSSAGSVGQTPENGVAPPQNPNLSLDSQIRAAFKASGVKDEDV